MGALRSPRGLDDITAHWLSGALAGLGAEVADVAVADQIPGSAVKIRLRLTYRNDHAGLPRTVILKSSLGAFPPAQEAAMFYPEIYAYQAILPHLSVNVNVPAPYYAGIDGDGYGVILMEDLTARGVTFRSMLQPLSFDEAALMLDQFAALHACWWQSPELAPGGPLAFVPETLEEGGGAGVLYYVRRTLQPERWASMVTWPRAHAVPRVFHQREIFGEAMERLRRVWRDMPHCVIHGDEHLGNMYVEADGRPGLLDWQAKKAPWAQAFTYFTVGALDIGDRRQWERPLLKRYLTQLAAHGIEAPEFDSAWLAYRQAILYGLFVWMGCGPAQPEVNCVAGAARFGLAALDHDTLGALGL